MDHFDLDSGRFGDFGLTVRFTIEGFDFRMSVDFI
jgi:hypothetical protein